MAINNNISKIKEVVGTWDSIQSLLRTGDKGALVPVVIPKDRRGFGWAFWFAFAFYALIGSLWFSSNMFVVGMAMLTAVVVTVVGGIAWWRSAIVEIEQGTTGVASKFGEIVGTLKPGRHYLWWPWEKVEYIAAPPSKVISIRITHNLDELEPTSNGVISALESKGYTLLETSKVYPNRPPNTKDGRKYLKFMPKN